MPCLQSPQRGPPQKGPDSFFYQRYDLTEPGYISFFRLPRCPLQRYETSGVLLFSDEHIQDPIPAAHEPGFLPDTSSPDLQRPRDAVSQGHKYLYESVLL